MLFILFDQRLCRELSFGWTGPTGFTFLRQTHRDDASGGSQFCAAQVSAFIGFDQRGLNFFIRSRRDDDCDPNGNSSCIDSLEQNALSMLKEVNDPICVSLIQPNLLRDLLGLVTSVYKTAHLQEQGTMRGWTPRYVLDQAHQVLLLTGHFRDDRGNKCLAERKASLQAALTAHQFVLKITASCCLSANRYGLLEANGFDTCHYCLEQKNATRAVFSAFPFVREHHLPQATRYIKTTERSLIYE